jgi:hypothetical protein
MSQTSVLALRRGAVGPEKFSAAKISQAQHFAAHASKIPNQPRKIRCFLTQGISIITV